MSIKLKDTIYDLINKAEKDGSGNTITSTYLKLSGGTMTGPLTMGQYDLNFKGSDPGDIVWQDADGKEIHRIWDNGGVLSYRKDAGTAYTILHSGNYSTWAATKGHTHNYAGSSSAGGSATSAVKLDTATAGSATQPVYFTSGKPVACTYTLEKSVPSDAKFTDTNTWRGITDSYSGTATDTSLSQKGGNALYNALLNGYANNAGSADYINSHDTRNATIAPNTYGNGFRCHFLANGTNGVNDGGNYYGLLHIKHYGSKDDHSGGYPFQIALTPNNNLWHRIGTSATSWGAWVRILDGNNSSVSGGGSTWGSSITVKIDGTTKTLTIPSNPNTWRGITDSYSGTATDTSLSQKGGNALYNALLNGYASSAGNADTVDNKHASDFAAASHTHDYAASSHSHAALAGGWYKGFTVDGDANTYYPVVISNVTSQYPMQLVSISRHYSATAPNSWYSTTHKGGLTLTLLWNSSRYWDGNGSGSPCHCVYKYESYCTMVGGLGNSTHGIVVWLRGGGAVYYLHSMNGGSATADVKLSSWTDSASNTFAPKTTVSSITVGWPYAIGAGNADTVDSKHASDFATSGHNHDSAYAAKSHTHSYAALSHTHTKSQITDFSHTHNYAGSSSAGGDANNSVKWGGYKIVVGSTGTATDTIYIIT